MRRHLTDLSVRALRAPAKGHTRVWDTNLTGFGLRIGSGGVKAWVVMTGRDRKLTTIGKFPATSLKEARQTALQLLAEPPVSKVAVSLESAVTLFLQANTATTRERTRSDYKGWLERNFYPTLRSRAVDKITTDELMAVVDGLGATPHEQHHAFNVAKTLFRFLTRRKIVTHNPLDGLRSGKRPLSRDRVLTDEEIAAVLIATETEPIFTLDYIIRLCLFTGQRRGEIGQLKWEWINQQDQTITLPAEITKNKWLHVFPYGRMARETLNQIPQRDGYLFPGRKYAFFNGYSRGKATFDLKCKIVPWTLHDLRRTVSSHMAALKIDQLVVEKLLNHRSQGAQSPIAAVYNKHRYSEEMRAALNLWEDKLESLVRG